MRVVNGYTEFRADLCGGRHASIKAKRAGAIKAGACWPRR
jgi:hypothetical protein